MDVLFINPITTKPAAMPVAMVNAYVPYAEHLHLEEAARVACIRDDEAATNLFLSVVEAQHPEVLTVFETITEGTSTDVLTAETS